MGGEEVDSLVLDVNNICGVVPIITTARRWHSTEDTTCTATARVIADSLVIGTTGAIHVVLDPEHTVLPRMNFRMGICANRTVLHLRDASLSSPNGVQCSIVDYWESGDTAVLVIEGQILSEMQAPINTLYSVTVLPLFGQLSSTTVGAYPGEPLTFTPDCSVLFYPAQVDVGDVCSSRPVRMVVFGHDDRTTVRSDGIDIVIDSDLGAASRGIQWEIHDLQGNRVGKGNTLHGPQRTPAASGVYAVTLLYTGAPKTVLLLH